MKEAFIAGFVKAAVDLGYDDDTIARVFKRAMASPMGAQLFNQLPQLPPQGVQPQMMQQPIQPHDPQQLAMIQQMLAAQGPQAQPM